MNKKQIELQETLFTNGEYDARRVKGGVPAWLHSCKGETISEKVWLHFNQRQLCTQCGNKTRFLTYPKGYRKTCSNKCGQTSIAAIKSVRQQNLWASKEWRGKTSLGMKTSHMNNRARAKLDKVAARDILPLEPITPGMCNVYKWQHSCGEVFERPFTRTTGIWCPACHVSRGQGELYESIKTLYSGTIIVNDRKAIKPKEIDIYLPELKLGFEYHGEYWHPGDGTREARKIALAAEQGIKLEEFWELLWKRERSTQLARLKTILKSARQK